MVFERQQCRSDPRWVGDPVDVVTGEMTDLRPDFVANGPIPFDWVRHYSSANCRVRGVVGNGFRHGFEHQLVRDLDGIRYAGPDGLVAELQELGVNESDAQNGVRVRRDSELDYLLIHADSSELKFSFADSDSDGRLTSGWIDGRSLEFAYDSTGRLTHIAETNKATIQISWNDAGLIHSLALIGRSEWAPTRMLVQYAYDDRGNLIEAVDLYAAVQSFTYDAANRLIQRTDRLGYSFLFEYDDLGRCVRSTGEDGVLEVNLQYHPDSRTTVVRHGNGAVWRYFYDPSGNITQITDPYGFAKKFVQDEQGRTVAEIDPRGSVTRVHYDGLGQADFRVDPNGNTQPADGYDEDLIVDPQAIELPETPLEWEQGHLLYTADIGRAEITDPVFAEYPAAVVNAFCGIFDPGVSEVLGGSPTTESGEIADSSPFDEDLLPFASRSEFDANGNLIAYQDYDGNVYRFTYASWNLPHQEMDPLGHTTTYAYGINLELYAATDAGGTEHRFAYDLKDRLTEVHYGGKLLETFLYDAADNLVEKRDASGRRLVAWEIGAGNLDRARVLGSGEVHEYEYNPRGAITKASSPEACVELDEDEFACLTKDTRDSLGIEHAFEQGEWRSTTYFKRFVVGHTMDAQGNSQIVDPTGAKHSFAVSRSGLVSRRYADGSSELIQYDSRGRCCRKAVRRGPDFSDLWLRSFHFSPQGDLRSIEDSAHGKSKYEYDAAHRLISASDGVQKSEFLYTPAGNLVAQAGLVDARYGHGNRVETANGDVFTYDRRDNLVSRIGPSGSTTYTYDDLDRLIACNINGQTWTAAYDALDRRISKTWNGETTSFYYDDFRLAAEKRPDGSLRLYLYADPTALVPFMFIQYEHEDATPESGQRFYIFADHLGVPVRVDDATGTTVWSAHIAPYGAAQITPGSLMDMPLRFPGHYCDAELGLHFNRFRYYSPELGCYIQADPLGIEGGLNLFAYVQNPLTEVDVDGLAKKCRTRRTKKKTPKKKPKGKGNKKPHVVYVHVDKKGKVVYIGITDNPKRRAKEHARARKRGEKRGVKMIVVSKPMSRDDARNIESQAIRDRIAATGGKPDAPVSKQLKGADLDNKDRGRSEERREQRPGTGKDTSDTEITGEQYDLTKKGKPIP